MTRDETKAALPKVYEDCLTKIVLGMVNAEQTMSSSEAADDHAREVSARLHRVIKAIEAQQDVDFPQ